MMNPNMNNLIGMFRQFQSNPTQFFRSRGMNISQDMLNDPNKIIQQMMNTGQLSQEQYQQAQNIARNIQNNPMFQNFFRR